MAVPRSECREVVADISTLSWVNMLLGSIWPKANTALIKYVHDELTPRLREVLPGPFKGLRFARFTLGNKVPEFGPIEVARHSDQHVQVEIDMRYFSDVDVLVDTDTSGISFGVNQLTFVGRLCLSIKPLLETWPVVGGVHVFFANQPRVELKFAGLAQVVNDFPGIADKIQGAVDDFFKNSVVLPNLKSFHMSRHDKMSDMTEASAHPPIGVLRIRVLQAKNLAGANWMFDPTAERFTSNPYCILNFGSASFRTSTVKNSSDPWWPDGEPSAYFAVHHQDQELVIEVLDEDRGILKRNFVAFLGRMTGTSVSTMLHRATREADGNGSRRRRRVVLDTSQVSKAMLHVNDPVNTGVPSELEFEIQWFDIQELLRLNPMERTPGLVRVEIHCGAGFPEDAIRMRKGVAWRCQLDQQQPVKSRNGELYFQPLELDTPLHPQVFGVVDKLVERGMSYEEIAYIVDSEACVVENYIVARDELHRQEQRRLADDEGCVKLKWLQTLAIVARRPLESCLNIELYEGEQIVGHLDPIPLQQLALEGGFLECTEYQLNTIQRGSDAGGLSTWLFPACNKPVMAKSRWSNVRVQISVRLQLLKPGDGPRSMNYRTEKAASDVASTREARPASDPGYWRGQLGITSAPLPAASN